MGNLNKCHKNQTKIEKDSTSMNMISSNKTNDGTTTHVSSSHSDIRYLPNEKDLLDPVLTQLHNNDVINRLLGCAYGQALGDAYGLSTEFENRHTVADKYPNIKDIIPFPNYHLTHHSSRWTRGDWTDDTDQWILILETLSTPNGDEIMFAKKLKAWIQQGFPELGDFGGMGLGANVSQVTSSSKFLRNPHAASEATWERGYRQAAPNGAIMRCSAAAFVHFRDIEKVKSTTISMCKVTHFDPRCIASCLAVCLTIAYLLQNSVAKHNDDDIEKLIEHVQTETISILNDQLNAKHKEDFLWYTHKDRSLEDLKLDEPSSIGYTYKCLASGFYGLRSKKSFQITLNDLIRYGGDADTNGAVCGTMFGTRYGFVALPYEWIQEMPFKKWFDRKILHVLDNILSIEEHSIDATF